MKKRFLKVIILLSFFFFIVPFMCLAQENAVSKESSPPATSAAEWLKKAKASEKGEGVPKDAGVAIIYYGNAIAADPNCAEAYLNRGILQFERKKLDEAAADLAQAISLDPRNGKAYFFRGVVYTLKSNFDQAIADYDEVIKIDANNVDVYLNRADAKTSKGDYAGALADYDKISEIKLDYCGNVYFFLRGRALYKAYKFEAALDDLDKSITKDPKFVDAYILRGNAYLFMHKYDKAISDFNQAISLDPNNSRAYNGRGMARYNHVLDTESEYNDRGIKNAQYDKEIQKAKDDFKKAVELNKANVDAQVNLLVTTKIRQEEKLQSLDQLLQAFPRSAKAHAWRGMQTDRATDGTFQIALSYLDKAISLDNTRAELYLYRGSIAMAPKDFMKAIEIYPNFASAYYYLRKVCRISKKYHDEGKIKEYEKKADELGSTIFHDWLHVKYDEEESKSGVSKFYTQPYTLYPSD